MDTRMGRWLDDGRMDRQAGRQTDGLGPGSLDLGSDVPVWFGALLLADSYWPSNHKALC